ncbi:YceI family protein [Sandaracinobacteroides hominis]|uniref:YceI family protein n=1 Tax=Sandaracinobacteroides hominis TaxID=2780086 RepID=UPI0018F6DF1E|nr:YceI family protein [Sandaracinobacteroides hominis]
MRAIRTTSAIILAAAAFAFATPVLAQAAPLDVPAGEYVVDKTHVSLNWKIRHLGLSDYTARFTSIDATINLDPKDVTKSSVTVTIDPKSVKTDFPFPEKEDFDKVIADKFLQAGQYPTITFQSTGLKATGAKTGKLTGNLTFLGVTKPVTLDVTLNGAMVHPMLKVPVLGFSAVGTFKRSDFGMTALQGPLGDEIKLLIEAEFRKK